MKEIVNKYSREIEETVRKIRKQLTYQNGSLGKEDEERLINDLVEDTFFKSEFAIKVDFSELQTVVEAILRRLRSKYGILAELLEDPEINEIMVNGPDSIFIERSRKLIPVDDAFTSVDELEGVIRMFASDVHREINEANPIVDARMENGYRINGVLRNVAINGPALTIRKFSECEITMSDLVRFGSLTEECSEDLCALAETGYNIFISGGTSSGKTTMLNALAACIGDEERVVVIEDSSELQVRHLKNKVHLECRSANSIGKGEVTMEMLIRTSLRMRPDRIIVGEVRGREVVDMIQAMNTGHSGSFSTGHGNSIKGMLNRLENMYLMDAQIPIRSIKNQIANAIEIFVHLRRGRNGMRQVVEVAELVGSDGEDYELNYLYQMNRMGELCRTENHLIHRENLERGGRDDRL